MNKKNKNIKVVTKNFYVLSPTSLQVAETLIKRKKAIWVEKEKVLMVLRTTDEFKKMKKNIIQEENRICYICNRQIPVEDVATIDHVFPKSKFGSDNRDNLKCCCKRCNDDKGNKDILTYINHIYNNKEKYTYIDFCNLEQLKRRYKDIEICDTSQSYNL